MGYKDGSRKVGTFWGENAGALITIGIVIFFLGVLAFFTLLEHSRRVTEKEAQVGQQEEDVPPRFIPPFLNRQPAPPCPLPWQKDDAITPIYWPYHHNRRHHAYPYGGMAVYDYGRYTRVVPWGYGYYGGLINPSPHFRYWMGEEEPRRPYFRQQRPDGTVTEWGLR